MSAEHESVAAEMEVPPSRARETMWLLCVAVASVVFACELFAPALGRRYFVFGTDTVAHDYIMYLYGWRELLEHQAFPLWCHLLFSGFPFVGSFAFCPFYPTQLAFLISDFNTSFTLQYVLAVAVGSTTTAIWARRMGLSHAAALFAGALFAVSGHFLTLTYAGHLQKMMAIAWAPLALAWARDLVAGGALGRRAVFVIGLAVGMQLLASHSQIAYLTSLAVAAYALPDVWPRGGEPASKSPWRRLSNLLVNAFFALLFALCLSAPQMFPGLEMSGISNRAGGVDFSEAVETSYPPRELWEFVISRVFGDSVRDTPTPYFGQWGERIVSDFVGWACILFAAVALCSGAGIARWRLLVLAVLSILIGLGKYTPLYRLCYDHVPGFAKFRSPGTFMFLATCCLTQLAAGGYDTLLRCCHDHGKGPRDARWSSRMLGASFWLLICAGFIGILWCVFPPQCGRILGIGTADQWLQHSDVLSNRIRMSGSQLAVSAFGLALAIFISRHAERNSIASLRKTLSRVLVAGVACFGLLITCFSNRHFIRFDPLSAYLEYLWNDNTTSSRCKGDRVLPENLLKNTGLVAEIPSVGGYHPVILGRYARLLQTLGWEHPRFLRDYAVGCALVTPGRTPRPSGFWRATSDPRVWRSAEDTKYVRFFTQMLVVERDEDVLVALGHLQEAAGSLPHACLYYLQPARYILPDIPVVTAKVLVQAAGAHFLLSSAKSDVWSQAFLRGPDTVVRLLEQPAGLMKEVVGQKTHDPRKKIGAYFVHSPGLLVIAENYAPGWKARTADGESLPVFPVNYAQIGVWAHNAGELDVRYEPFGWRFGFFVGVSTLAFVLGVVVSALLLRWGFLRRSDWTSVR